MIYTIIPCFNEEESIREVIKNACLSKSDRVLVVENGSYDNSLRIIKKLKNKKLEVISFNVPLGHDIPRAVGLYFGKRSGGNYFVFIDGDMTGIKAKDINKIIDCLLGGTDLCLTDCYSDFYPRSSLARHVIYYRELLNRELNLFNNISYSTPSHGPHGISYKIADSIPPSLVAIPPMILSFAAERKLKISIGLDKPHESLKSPDGSQRHSIEIAKTIIGDSLSALNYYKNKNLSRTYKTTSYIGYHIQRRFDILDLLIAGEGACLPSKKQT